MNRIAKEFIDLLDAEAREEELHKFLYSHSFLLKDFGYGTKLVFSKPSFGSNFKADFALVGWGNYAVWTFVELEKPSDRLFTKEGLFTQALRNAVEQVNSWWIWMYDYGEYASEEYRDLSGDRTAVIIIGRRKSLCHIDLRRLKHFNATQLAGKLRIATYDSILDASLRITDEELPLFEKKHNQLTRYKNLSEYHKSFGLR